MLRDVRYICARLEIIDLLCLFRDVLLLFRYVRYVSEGLGVFDMFRKFDIFVFA